MRLVEKELCWLIEDVFGAGVVAGFTKAALPGNLPQDALAALAFLPTRPQVAHLNQLHSASVNQVEAPGLYQGDGLFSRQRNLLLAVRTADCLPLFFCAQDASITGIVHMGWRSAQAGILDKLDCDLSRFRVLAGAGLRACCYQVGPEFKNYPDFAGQLQEKASRLYFDPVSFAGAGLGRQGLPQHSFFDLNLCSFCSGQALFSYRRSQTPSRTISFIFKS